MGPAGSGDGDRAGCDSSFDRPAHRDNRLYALVSYGSDRRPVNHRPTPRERSRGLLMAGEIQHELGLDLPQAGMDVPKTLRAQGFDIHCRVARLIT
jgi:hypothetical protein